MTGFQKLIHCTVIIAFACTVYFAPLAATEAAGGKKTGGGQANANSSVGPQGPVGPQGAVGPQGPVGPQTAPGPQSDTTTLSSTTDQTNSNTGTGSSNTNSSSDTTSTSVTNSDTATIDNNVNLNLNTGNTTLNNNTAVGMVNSGNIQGSVTVINVANSNLASGSTISSQTVNPNGPGPITLSPSANRTAIGTNTITGPNSANQNLVDNSNVIKVNDTSSASALNNYTIDASTGNLTTTANTSVAGISTGNVNLGLNTINALNITTPVQLTVDVWAIPQGYNGDIIIPSLANASAGPDSSNANTVISTNSDQRSSIQNANVANTVNLHTNTGGLLLGQNSDVGNVSTGTTTVRGSAVNIANEATPTYYLVNVYGTWNGTIEGIDPGHIIVQDMSNGVTGAQSTNTNSVTNSEQTDINVTNNAEALNNFTINADTGHITATENTKLGDVSSGNITIFANTVNVLNAAAQGTKALVLGIINIFGDWNGNALSEAPASGSGTASPDPAATAQGNDVSAPAQVTSTASGITVTLPPDNPIGNSVKIQVTPSGATPPSAPSTFDTNLLASNPVTMAHLISGPRYITAYTDHIITYEVPQTVSWDEIIPAASAASTPASSSSHTGSKQIPRAFWYTLATITALLGVWGMSEVLALRAR